MKDDADSSEVPEVLFPSVRAEILTKVIEFCTHYKSEPMKEIEMPLKSSDLAEVVQKWYADFIDVDQAILFEIVIAANFLNIQPLLDLTCACVAGLIKGKTPEEIRKTFNIVNDFTPEEEAQVREENKWCEEA
jgi:S-phase kinase-associated protein 1